MTISGTYSTYETSLDGEVTRIRSIDGTADLDIGIPNAQPPEMIRFIIALYETGIAVGKRIECDDPRFVARLQR